MLAWYELALCKYICPVLLHDQWTHAHTILMATSDRFLFSHPTKMDAAWPIYTWHGHEHVCSWPCSESTCAHRFVYSCRGMYHLIHRNSEQCRSWTMQQQTIAIWWPKSFFLTSQSILEDRNPKLHETTPPQKAWFWVVRLPLKSTS